MSAGHWIFRPGLAISGDDGSRIDKRGSPARLHSGSVSRLTFPRCYSSWSSTASEFWLRLGGSNCPRCLRPTRQRGKERSDSEFHFDCRKIPITKAFTGIYMRYSVPGNQESHSELHSLQLASAPRSTCGFPNLAPHDEPRSQRHRAPAWS